MNKFFTMLLGAIGGVMILVVTLSIVFNAEVALRPLGITVGILGILFIAVSWLLGETIKRRTATPVNTTH